MSSRIITLQDVIAAFERHGNRPALLAVQKKGVEEWSFAELTDMSGRLAVGLRRAGLQAGERAALLAPSRPEWIAACFALIRAGIVPVLIDAQIGSKALAQVLDDSDVSAIFSAKDLVEKLPQSEGAADRKTILLDGPEDDPRSWRQFLAQEAIEPHQPSADDMAVLFYTSGTSGSAKGVPLSHGNIASNLQALIELDLLAPSDRVLLPLPLHHVYPFTVGMLVPLTSGVPIAMPQSLSGPQIVRAMKETQATVLLGVPRIYSALLGGIKGRIAQRGRVAAGVFRALLTLSMAMRRLGVRVGRGLFARLHREMAPSLQMVTSGGSAIDPGTVKQLEGLGWRFADGYGLTETSPVVAFNLPGRARIGTVGRPLAGVEVRIAEPESGRPHGEILAKGPNVFSGYWNRPEETEAAFTSQGYFRTGDLGEFDQNGYLRVFGRASSLIVLPGGENVWPEDIEEAFAQSDAISEAGVLLHEGKLVAVVVPDPDQHRGGEEAESRLRQEVSGISRDLPSHHRVTQVLVSREPLARTRLGKLRRHLLEARFAELQRGEGDGEKTPRAGPLPVEEMPSEYQALFDEPAVRRTWDWLAQRFPEARLTPQTGLETELGVDSMEWMRLGLEIQQQTGHELTEEAIGRMETVGDLLRAVAEARQAGAAESEDMLERLREPHTLLDDEQRRWLRGQGPVTRGLGAFCIALDRLALRWYTRLRVIGHERVAGQEPMIIAPNHHSFLDAPALAAALPDERLRRTYWGGAVNVMFRTRLRRLLSRATRVFPVDPRRHSAASLAAAAAVLQRGDSLVWFPEGGVARDGRLQPFLPGVGLLLQAHPVPVVPVWIEGSYEALPYPSRWPRRQQIAVRFGEPLAPDDLPRDGEGDLDRAERVAEFLRDRVVRLGEE